MNKIVTHKKCTQCKEDKFIIDFSFTQKGKYLSSICKPCMAKRTKEYYRLNKKKISDNAKEKRKNPSFIKANRERVREWVSNNIERHRELHKIRESKRRARLLGKGSFSLEEWNSLCSKYDNRCLCCGELKMLTIDHVVPVVMGGRNTIDNIQPLCMACNSRKHDKTIDYRY